MALKFDENMLTGDEHRLLRRNNRNNLLHYLEGQARERKLENDLRIVGNDPGRMAPQTREAILNEAERLGIGRQAQERGRLMDHELKMLGLKNEGELKVAEQKRFGMAEQGMKAAGLRADTDKIIASNTNETALKKHELEMASREKIAGMENETKKYGLDTEFDIANLEDATKRYGIDKNAEIEKDRTTQTLAQHEEQMALQLQNLGIRQDRLDNASVNQREQKIANYIKVLKQQNPGMSEEELRERAERAFPQNSTSARPRRSRLAGFMN